MWIEWGRVSGNPQSGDFLLCYLDQKLVMRLFNIFPFSWWLYWKIVLKRSALDQWSWSLKKVQILRTFSLLGLTYLISIDNWQTKLFFWRLKKVVRNIMMGRLKTSGEICYFTEKHNWISLSVHIHITCVCDTLTCIYRPSDIYDFSLDFPKRVVNEF